MARRNMMRKIESNEKKSMNDVGKEKEVLMMVVIRDLKCRNGKDKEKEVQRG